MVEQEQKYEVDDAYVLPDLAGTAPAGGRFRALPPVTLAARYLDTVDLRLARAGASLRHRRGDELPWTVKLPTGTPGVRHEVSRPGPTGQPPPELVELVTVLHREAPDDRWHAVRKEGKQARYAVNAVAADTWRRRTSWLP